VALHKAYGNVPKSPSGDRLAAHGISNRGPRIPVRVSGGDFEIVSLVAANLKIALPRAAHGIYLGVVGLSGLFLMLGERGNRERDGNCPMFDRSSPQVYWLRPKDTWKALQQPGVYDPSEAGWCPSFRFLQ
jgi:hypothetical protein